MATYVIGDVQGCFEQLKMLLDKINYNPNNDTLWFAGDIVNRGPDSLATVRFIMQQKKAITILGNHDISLLARAFNAIDAKSKDTFEDILLAEDKDILIDWLLHRPLVHYSEEFKTIMVHAGIPPQWNLNQALRYSAEIEDKLQKGNPKNFLQSIFHESEDTWSDNLTGTKRYCYIVNALTRMRFCYPNGKLELKTKDDLDSRPKDTYPWFSILNRELSSYEIVFGHWASIKGITNQNNVHALDTGCIWKGSLTAMRLEDKRLFSISCADCD